MPARVLWLTKGLGLGGAERLISLMVPRLDRSRFTVDVAYLLPWKAAMVGELEAAGVRVSCLGARRTVDPAWPIRLGRLLAARRYDIVHTHSPVPAAAARLLAGRRTVLIHTEHNVWDRYRWATYAVNAATYRRNAHVIAVSDGVADSICPPWWMRRAPYPNVEALHHGVDVRQIGSVHRDGVAARGRLDLPTSSLVVGTVANFTPKKDHQGLLLAVQRLAQDFPDLTVLLIGSGPLDAEIRARVEALGLYRQVRFLGSRDDVPDLLPALDVFVLGSRFEGLPISLLEAMAAGVACVATRVGGIPEAISDGREGLLVPPGRPDALADALRRLLIDPALRSRMGEAGRERVEARFSIDRAVERTVVLYEEQLNRRNHDQSSPITG